MVQADGSTGARADGDKPVFFVGGMLKSGTTWVQLLLDAHPAVCCGGETHAFNHAVPRLMATLRENDGHARAKGREIFAGLSEPAQLLPEDMEAIARDAVRRLLRRQPGHDAAAIVGEKTPDNILNVPAIRRLFPDARIVHAVRDGRDCAVSAWYHNLRVRPDWLRRYPSFDAFALHVAAEWAACLDAGRRAAAIRPDRVRELRYEDLTDRPRETLAGLLGFLGVDASDAAVAACLDAADFRRLSGRERGEEDRGAFLRRGATGDWRAHMSPGLAARFETASGPWLRRLGYA